MLDTHETRMMKELVKANEQIGAMKYCLKQLLKGNRSEYVIKSSRELVGEKTEKAAA